MPKRGATITSEATLYSSEAHFRELAEIVPEFIWTARADGQADYFNRHWYRYTGATREQAAGDGWVQLLHPDDRERAWNDWQTALRNGEPLEVEYRLRAADDTHQWFLTRATPLKDGSGRIVKWFGSSTNIHKQKAAEEALRRADRRKDEFLATLAHELRNPLAPIRNAVQIIQLQGLAAPDSQWALDVIDRQSRQMARLMDDLLDVARITRNRLEMRMQRVELADVVRTAVETSRPLIEDRRHRLTVNVPPGEIFLDADLTRLAQALSNLLNNAAKYTPPGGRIELEVERQDGAVLLKVRDNGIGISAAALSGIFELFAQVDLSLERSPGGLGIGLSLARRLIAMHGGTLTAHSDGPGKGTEFTVRLPVTAAGAAAKPAAPRPPAAKPAPRRILLVDDNRLAAMSLSLLLRTGQHEVRLAHDGEEAVRAAAEFRPEVVVLDIGLPKLNGYDAARKIRQETWGRNMVLIALTGWGQDEDKRRAREAGFDHHLVKPVDAATLTQLLDSLDQARTATV
jgi:two-component system CheB/CheR fusion protein